MPSSPTAVTSPSPWAQSGWLSMDITPLCSSPTISSSVWNNNSDLDNSERRASSVDADELVSNLILPLPLTVSPLPSSPRNNNNNTFVTPNIRDMCDTSNNTFSPSSPSSSPSSPSISQPFLTLPAAQASKCAFPPSCPVLVYQKDTCTVEVGVVKAVVMDLSLQPGATTGVHYVVESSNSSGGSIGSGNNGNNNRVAEQDLQFAPQCPVWFQPLHDSGSQVKAVVLASYHAPTMLNHQDCLYSVLVVESCMPMVHHGVRLLQLSYRPSSPPPPPSTFTVSPTPSKFLLKKDFHKNFDRCVSVPSEVVTTTTVSDASSTGSLSEPTSPCSASGVEVTIPPGFVREPAKKLSTKIHIPTWIADTNDLENDLIDPNAKFLCRVEEKTNCSLEVDRVVSSSSSSSSDEAAETQGTMAVVTIYCEDIARLAGARTYVENLIIDRVHERLEGRMLYHFALDQAGEAFVARDSRKIVLQRGPENRKVDAYMIAIPLPSEVAIRAVIGKGGRFINFLRSMTGCSVTLESRLEITTEPFVHISGSEREKVEEAVALVEEKIQGKV